MNKFRNLLRNVGIGQRLFFGFIALPLIVMIFFFLLYYNFSRNIIISKNKETSQQIVSMSSEIFHLNMTKMEEQIDDLGSRTMVYDMLLAPSNQENEERLQAYMDDTVSMDFADDLLLYDVSGKLIFQGNEAPLPDDLFQKLATYDNYLHWVYDDQTGQVFLTKIMNYHGTTIGYVTVVYSQEAFSTTFAQTGNETSMLIVVDGQNRYLFGQQDMVKGSIVNTEENEIDFKGSAYYQTSQSIEGMDWKIVNLINSDYVMAEIYNFRNMMLLYALAILIMLAILSTFVYHSIYDPIANILKSMRKLDETNLSNNQVQDIGKDELNELSTNFNDLLNRVQELLATVESEQEQKRITQIQLLQAQINPHFLFNTLNTLHYLAILNEDHPVCEGIGALSKLLRNTIVDSNDYVTIKEEIENVKNYIIIQKLRFGDLFETVYNIDENVTSCRVLKFLLQPIVENSVLHAFEEDEEHQLLTIRVKEEDIYLKIEIGDNGKGFEHGHTPAGSRKLSSIGIINIQERIRLMYGEKYAMHIQSEVGKGTIVTLLLPLMKGGNYVQGIDRRR